MLEDLPASSSQLSAILPGTIRLMMGLQLCDIDGSKVIWAREMDGANNIELIQHYKDRKAWLVQPDLDSAILSPYPFS